MKNFLMALLIGATLTTSALAEQKTFGTPKQAAEAVIAACMAQDREQMVEIFGPEILQTLNTKDPAQARQELETVALAGNEQTSFESRKDGSVVWLLGDQVWPFPVPLVQENGYWRFDTAAGREEMEARRIGRDELAALDMLKTLAAAQEQYATADYDADGVLEFARQVLSTPGLHDGLYWQPDGLNSPMQETADAYKDYLASKKEDGWFGYRFKILTQQGEHAAGGAYDYLINGYMIGGYALVAWPVEYGRTGVATFLLNHNGKIFERDLGEGTDNQVRAMTTFDPDRNWKEVSPSGLDPAPVLKRPGT